MNNFFSKYTKFLAVLAVLFCLTITSCTKNVIEEEIQEQHIVTNQQKEVSTFLDNMFTLASVDPAAINNKSGVTFPTDCSNLTRGCYDPGFTNKAAYIAYCAIHAAALDWCPDQNDDDALIALQNAICNIYTVNTHSFYLPKPPSFCN